MGPNIYQVFDLITTGDYLQKQKQKKDSIVESALQRG